MKKVMLFLFFFSLVVGCSSNLEVDRHQLVSVNKNTEVEYYSFSASTYFPRLVTRNEYRAPNGDGKDEMIVSIAKYIAGQPNEEVRVLDETTYSKGKGLNKVTEYYVTNDEIIRGDEVILTNKSHWESNGWLYEIMDTNVKLTVKAGTFSDVIKVKQTDIETGLVIIVYHAPYVGVLKGESISPKFGESLLYELTRSDFSPYVGLGFNQSTNEQQQDRFQQSNENETIDENPIRNLNSGKLPDSTGNVSQINFSDYRELVDQYSMENFNTMLMHRPMDSSENDTQIMYAFYDDIQVVLDKETNHIVEVNIDQKGISEMSFEISRALLFALDNRITDEIVDAVLYPVDEQVVSFLNYEAGMILSEQYFKLRIVVK